MKKLIALTVALLLLACCLMVQAEMTATPGDLNITTDEQEEEVILSGLVLETKETLNKEPTQIEFDDSEWEKGKSQQTRVPKTQIQEDKPSKGRSVPISSCNRILERTS